MTGEKKGYTMMKFKIAITYTKDRDSGVLTCSSIITKSQYRGKWGFRSS